MKQKSTWLALFLASTLALVGVAQLSAQGPSPRNPRAPSALLGTTFTYQGQLKEYHLNNQGEAACGCQEAPS